MDDYYTRLRVDKNATSDEIKKSYKKLAMEFHPDRTNGNKEKEDMFKLISHAYSVLSDADARKKYDLYGDESIADFTPINLNDLFSDILGDVSFIFIDEMNHIGSPFTFIQTDIPFNLNNSHVPVHKPESDYIDIQVSLKEMYLRHDRIIEFDVTDRCSGCAHFKRIQCMTCRGLPRRDICGSCQGHGFITVRPCAQCNNTRQEMIKRTITVKIPYAVEHKMKVTYTGRGSFEPGTETYRDLVIQFHHSLPKGVVIDRRANVHLHIPVNIADVFCGFRKVINIHDSPIELISMDAIDPSKPFCFENRGLPLEDGNATSLYVHLVVTYPDKAVMLKLKSIFTTLFKRGPVKESSHPRPLILKDDL